MTYEETIVQLVQIHLKDAHAQLVKAAKFAQCEKLEKISKLIDSLEAILEQD